MQDAVPKGARRYGCSTWELIPDQIEKIILENNSKYECFIANDNSNGQLVVSGTY